MCEACHTGSCMQSKVTFPALALAGALACLTASAAPALAEDSGPTNTGPPPGDAPMTRKPATPATDTSGGVLAGNTLFGSPFPIETKVGGVTGSTGGEAGVNVFDNHGRASASLLIGGEQVINTQANAAADAFNNQIYNSSASGSITYYLTVTGPTFGAADLVVPLHLIGGYELGGSQSVQDATFEASVGFNMFGFNDLTAGTSGFGAACNVNVNQCGGQSFFADFSVNAFANHRIGDTVEIVLQARAAALANNVAGTGGVAGANAFIDPMITIDTDWLADNPGFQLNFSDGVVNGTGLLPDAGGVPEPATWALMIAGFGLVGTVLRRRRTATFLA